MIEEYMRQLIESGSAEPRYCSSQHIARSKASGEGKDAITNLCVCSTFVQGLKNADGVVTPSAPAVNPRFLPLIACGIHKNIAWGKWFGTLSFVQVPHPTDPIRLLLPWFR